MDTYIISTAFDELHFVRREAGHRYWLHAMWWVQTSPVYNTRNIFNKHNITPQPTGTVAS